MKNVLMILQLVPVLIEIIRTVESLFPQSGAGKEKLVLVREILTTAHEGITELWPSIEIIIEKVVAFANRIGAFTKS